MDNYSKGQEINLEKANLYATYYAKESTEQKTGLFFIYNDAIKEGRIRITDSAEKVDNPRMCTGWVNISDIKE